MSDDKDRAMEKIRKLLAMGMDGRGNMHEAEAAMRQAQALMRKWQIDSVDEVLADLKGGKDMIRETESIWAYPSKNRPTRCPAWVGVVALAVSRFCQTKSDVTYRPDTGVVVRFSGYGPDVQFSRWLYRYLIETIHQLACKAYASCGEREDFRFQAAGVVQRRMTIMEEEQAQADKAEQESKVAGNCGTALILFAAKKQTVAEYFGPQKINKQSRDMTDAGADGYRAGQRLNIPTARPLEGQAQRKELS